MDIIIALTGCCQQEQFNIRINKIRYRIFNMLREMCDVWTLLQKDYPRIFEI